MSRNTIVVSIVLLMLVGTQYCFIALDVDAYGERVACHIFNRSVQEPDWLKNQLNIPPFMSPQHK
jgi:hypothetical protein